MITAQTTAAIRFGYGPAGRGAASPEGLLAGLARGEEARARFPGYPLSEALGAMGGRTRAAAGGGRRDVKFLARDALLRSFARMVETETPFFERLVWFWADHFTVAPTRGPERALPGPYVDDAIRPHVTGRFADMLIASATHPAMLSYLDQAKSFGPASVEGRRQRRGLNENLAREILELHTLGVGADYSQKDVRQFAELLTGLTYDLRRGFHFDPAMAQPGAEKLLGKIYGNALAQERFIFEALEDLALHPATARHIATKLATHFVADRPDPDLVAALEAAYRASEGQMMALYETLLGHPAAWDPPGAKVRQPLDYLAACLTALGVEGDFLIGLDTQGHNRVVARPLAEMGQVFMRAPGPNGWPEEAGHWITPQGLAKRIGVARQLARAFPANATDPPGFLRRALGEAARPELDFAVRAAVTREDAVMLVLASPEMNRR